MLDWQPSTFDRRRRAHTESPRPIDVAVALGLAALSLVAFVGGATTIGPRDGVTVVLLLLESLPLVLRRRYPLEVFLVIVAATIAHIAILPSDQELQAGLGILVAMYTIGERLDRQASIPLAVLAGTVIAVLLIGRGGIPLGLQSLIQTELILGVAWLVGDTSRIRHLYTRALEERARLLDREREERTRRAVLEERERIARELHDVVAHHVSVMVIQAGGASSAIDRRPDQARTALTAIATAGRQALTDMRRLVTMPGTGEAAEPMPGLAQLDALVDEVRSAGLPVELTVQGEPRVLDPGLDLSAYRILQEGLTNSLKHAGAGKARATVRYATDALEITVEDERGSGNTPPLEPDHEGRGLLGMRERVAMFRGTLDAGPTPTGFRIFARLPVVDGGPR
jgi:signal transduction histidine kinase